MELHLVSELAKCKVFTVTLTVGAKKWFKVIPARTISSWQQLSTSFLQHFQTTRKSVVPLAHLENVKQKKGETLKSYINRFNKTSNFMTWSPDVGVLAHLTNRVLLETPFWDELQQKKCQSMDEFYRKARKYLKLEDFKEALCKAKGVVTNKKNDRGTVLDGGIRQDKRWGEDKRANSLKKQRSGPIENRGPPPKYTNYHSLNAPIRSHLRSDLQRLV